MKRISVKKLYHGIIGIRFHINLFHCRGHINEAATANLRETNKIFAVFLIQLLVLISTFPVQNLFQF